MGIYRLSKGFCFSTSADFLKGGLSGQKDLATEQIVSRRRASSFCWEYNRSSIKNESLMQNSPQDWSYVSMMKSETSE